MRGDLYDDNEELVRDRTFHAKNMLAIEAMRIGHFIDDVEMDLGIDVRDAEDPFDLAILKLKEMRDGGSEKALNAQSYLDRATAIAFDADWCCSCIETDEIPMDLWYSLSSLIEKTLI